MAGKQTQKSVPDKEDNHTQPSFREMIKDAINNLNNPKGVSSEEMFQYLVAKYNLVENTAKRSLNVALSYGVKRGDLMKTKIAGSTYVYSLKDNDTTRHKRKTKKTVAPPGVKEHYRNRTL